MTDPTPATHPDLAGDGAGVVVRIPMRWGDMDVYGHVNNVEIVRMLEEARIGVFGIPTGTGRQATPPVVPLFDALDDGVQALVVEHRVKYLRPLEYGSRPAPCRVRVVRASGAALVLGIEIFDAATGQACVRAHTQLAFYRPDGATVLRLTPDQRALLEPHAGPALLS